MIQSTVITIEDTNYNPATLTFTTKCGRSWSYGQRGRKPSWVADYEQFHDISAPEKETVEPISLDEVYYDDDTKTFSARDKSWSYGQRGRKPYWVKEYEAENDIEVPVRESKKIQATHVSEAYSGLYEWRLKSQVVNCIIVAENAAEAIVIGNKAFKSAISGNELRVMWEKRQASTDLGKGVWKLDAEEWSPYNS